MTQLANERVAYINGNIVPESQALVSFRDRSFRMGDGVFDTTRTFGHKIYRLDEHIARLYRSLRYVRMDSGLKPDELVAITEDVLERNLHLIDERRGLLGHPACHPWRRGSGRRAQRAHRAYRDRRVQPAALQVPREPLP